MSMTPGRMECRITVMKPGTVEDGEYGPQPGDPVVVGPPRMPAEKYDSLPSRAEDKAGALQMAERPSRIRIRFVPGMALTSDMFIIVHDEDDAKYEISAGPARIGRRAWWEFTVKEYSS